MITKSFKNVLAAMLQRNNGGAYGFLSIVAVGGTTYYCANSSTSSNYPFTAPIETVTTNINYNGIRLGTDNTPATENDYDLKSQITSGITGTASKVQGVDASGNPYLTYTILVTNTTASDITVREIGYVQSVQGTASQGGTGASARNVLIDRTVLDTPVTIPANDSAGIKYTLKTVVASV